MYPLWITDNMLKFKGTKLVNTSCEASGFTNYRTLIGDILITSRMLRRSTKWFQVRLGSGWKRQSGTSEYHWFYKSLYRAITGSRFAWRNFHRLCRNNWSASRCRGRNKPVENIYSQKISKNSAKPIPWIHKPASSEKWKINVVQRFRSMFNQPTGQWGQTTGLKPENFFGNIHPVYWVWRWDIYKKID